MDPGSELELYKKLKAYVLTPRQLEYFNYPVKDPANENELIVRSSERPTIKNNYSTNIRHCSRCDNVFYVDSSGLPVVKESCRYHNRPIWPKDYEKFSDPKHSCCGARGGAPGCCTGEWHIIYGTDHPSYNQGYVRTKPKLSCVQFPGIFALDCEMCFTTAGIELTMISIIDHNKRCVYETLVKPGNPILDPNTKFSGLTKEEILSSDVTLKDVQMKMLTLFHAETILIGHALENDLKVLKLFHETVVDTVAMYPHPRGLPYKNNLDWLVRNKLRSIKKSGKFKSRADAMASLKLALSKVG